MTFEKCVIGVDEVGRGPLAGPITLAVAFFPNSKCLREAKLPLRDSKKLSSHQRNAWMVFLHLLHREGRAYWAVASISARDIDRRGIASAAKTAATLAMRRLFKKNPDGRKAQVFLDAGLSLHSGILSLLRLHPISRVRADETIAAVAIASIIAKAHRDRRMEMLGVIHPAYGFAEHKGYGTSAHYRALRRHGPIKEHRLTFLGNLATIRKNYHK